MLAQLYLDIVLSNINGSVGILLVAELEEALLITGGPKTMVWGVEDVSPKAPS